MLNWAEYKRVSECTMAGSLTMNCSLLDKLVRVLVLAWVQSIFSIALCRWVCTKRKEIDTLHEKLLFVKRHILHDILLPTCSTFGPELEIVDGLNVSNGLLMHISTVFSAIQFNCIGFGDCFQPKTRHQTSCCLRCVAYIGTHFAIDFAFVTFNWNYIPLCLNRGIFAISTPSHSCVFVWIFIWNFENKRILNDRLQFPFCISKPVAAKPMWLAQRIPIEWRWWNSEGVHNCIGRQLYPIKCFFHFGCNLTAKHFDWMYSYMTWAVSTLYSCVSSWL